MLELMGTVGQRIYGMWSMGVENIEDITWVRGLAVLCKIDVE
jgi:hypothetical protein